MPNDNTPIVDPDGQPLMNGLSELGMAPEDAYNVVQGVREMSGQKAIAEIRAQGAEIRALVAETNALVATTHAETRAEIAALASRVDANTARLDTMGWTVTATLALVVALAAAGLLNWMTGRWADSQRVRNESSG